MISNISTGSIKRTGFAIFQKFLLNVPYDLKIEGLNSLTYRTYNRNHRVHCKYFSCNISGF